MGEGGGGAAHRRPATSACGGGITTVPLEARFLPPTIGLALEDELVGGVGQPVDGALSAQGIDIVASHSSGSRLEVTTVERRWWRSSRMS